MSLPTKSCLQLSRLALAAVVAFCASGLVVSSDAWADTIVKRDGSQLENVKIQKATFKKIEYRLPGVSVKQSVDADEVERINWQNIPAAIKSGRSALEKGDYAEAADKLKKTLNAPGAHGGYAHFLLGQCYIYWGSQESDKFGEAVKVLKQHATKFKGKDDFYEPRVLELLGNAHIATKNFSEAEKAFDKLASGTYGNNYKKGADLGKAKVLLAQGKAKPARELFRTLADTAKSEDLKRSAWLGYAESQLAQKSYDGVAATVKDKILNQGGSSPRFDSAKVKAFILWGDAEAASSDKKKQTYALIRYLRAIAIGTPESDLLAEATYKAKEVCKALGWNDKATQLQEELQKLYPKSPWNK